MKSRRARGLSALVVAVVLLAACSSGKSSNTTSGSSASNSGSSSGTAAAGFKVDTSKCADPAAATKKIEGTLKIGSTMPLSGGPAATAFAPVKAGFESYVKYANEQNLVPGVKLELTIEDDQYKADLTTPAVEKLIDQTKVDIFAGIIGTPNNAAVRPTLNEECIPQLAALTGAPQWGDVTKYPWTTGGLPPYNVETQIYGEDIKQQFPNGAKVALFRVNNDFGKVFENALNGVASGDKITVVDTQSIEAADSSPPTAQVNAIVAKNPDVIVAVPLGAQCITFLNELANAKAANASFKPRVYITNTCSSSLLLGAAGQSADGIFTTAALKDVNDPANASDAAVKLLKDRLTADGFSGDFGTAAAGWGVGEAVVKAVVQAQKSPDGLTRASILNAARSLSFHPALFRDGIDSTMNGADDAFAVESLQIVQYKAASKTFDNIGSVISKFEGKTKPS